jgi:hypothetical protein
MRTCSLAPSLTTCFNMNKCWEEATGRGAHRIENCVLLPRTKPRLTFLVPNHEAKFLRHRFALHLAFVHSTTIGIHPIKENLAYKANGKLTFQLSESYRIYQASPATARASFNLSSLEPYPLPPPIDQLTLRTSTGLMHFRQPSSTDPFPSADKPRQHYHTCRNHSTLRRAKPPF